MTGMNSAESALRGLPSVDRVLRDQRVQEIALTAGAETVKSQVQLAIESARSAILNGATAPDFDQIIESALAAVDHLARSPLTPVINATGVVIHTNLGRAPLSGAAIEAIRDVASGYSNLEFDLDVGARGSRDRHAESLLQRLTGAESALVVNNNASALLLVLSALSAGREAIISRGQAVEIGGGFRIPDVMRQSGAKLVEVGTTNRTYITDYRSAIGPDTAVVMRVHSSNFKVVGFTAEAGLDELCALAAETGVDLVDDLGSGCLLDTARYGLVGEPRVQESVAAGASVVCFSGDKLLGGPQAGIILGKKSVLSRIRRHPLARAVRIDKLSLAALIATLLHYQRGEAEREIPVWRMISAPLEVLTSRVEHWQRALGGAIVQGRSAVGGGSLPGETLPTELLALTGGDGATALAARLRAGRTPVVGRVEHDRLVLDPRTVLPEQDEALVQAVRAALA